VLTDRDLGDAPAPIILLSDGSRYSHQGDLFRWHSVVAGRCALRRAGSFIASLEWDVTVPGTGWLETDEESPLNP